MFRLATFWPGGFWSWFEHGPGVGHIVSSNFLLTIDMGIFSSYMTLTHLLLIRATWAESLGLSDVPRCESVGCGAVAFVPSVTGVSCLADCITVLPCDVPSPFCGVFVSEGLSLSDRGWIPAGDPPLLLGLSVLRVHCVCPWAPS